jgi:hypothetical protein
VWLSLYSYRLTDPGGRIVSGRRVVRTATLVPYGLITVVAAYAWQWVALVLLFQRKIVAGLTSGAVKG